MEPNGLVAVGTWELMTVEAMVQQWMMVEEGNREV